MRLHHRIRNVDRWLKKYESTNQIFSKPESWMLYKIAAISEACGWTLLVIGIGLAKYVFTKSNIPLILAGRIHGTIFISYILAVIFLYPNLRWSRKKTLVAGLASIPPYGSLAFELWASFDRRAQQMYNYNLFLIYHYITTQTESKN